MSECAAYLYAHHKHTVTLEAAKGVGFSGTGAIQSEAQAVGSSVLPWDPGFAPQRTEAGSRAVVLGLPNAETL